MRLARPLCLIGVALLAASFGLSAQAGSVSVGSSSLIGALDYSDTFTGSDFGGLPDRDAAGGWPLSAVDYPANGVFGEGLPVEKTYGNPARSWTDTKWSIARDGAGVLPTEASPFPGGSGGGSATGITQTGGGSNDWGIEYGLRRQFVVQLDAVQSSDRVDVTIGPVRDNFFVTDAMTVFFRADGSSLFEIGLFAGGIGERDSGLSSTGSVAQWHNFAVKFDLDARTLEPFIDEVSRGVVDLNTVADGAFASVNLTSAAVSVGYFGGNRMWTDNFQVGSPIPEPGTIALCLGGLVGLVGILRKRRA